MISIIVPVYNAEKTIDRCVNSIFKQTYKDYEVVLVNDGSTDNSLALCENLASGCAHVRVIDKANGGVSSARNAGLEQAAGEYVCFIDSDDMIVPEYLEKLYSMIMQAGSDMAICRMKKSADAISIADEIHTLSSQEMLERMAKSKISFGVCNILLKTEVIKANGLKFAEGYKYSEDLHFVWRAVSFCNKISYTAEAYYIYLDTEGSAMSKFNSSRKDSLVLFDDLLKFFKEYRPEFSKKFERYVVSKSRWSLAWQAAIKLDKEEYVKLCDEIRMKYYFRKLVTHPSLKVALSSIVGLISLRLFRCLARKFAKKLVH